MKTDYILKHVGPNMCMTVCTFPTRKLAEKAREHYAKYVELQHGCKETYRNSSNINFDNLHSIIIFEELRASTMKEFERMIELPTT